MLCPRSVSRVSPLLIVFSSLVWTAAPVAATAAETEGKSSEPSKLESLTKDMQRVDGLWTMYHDDQKLLVQLKSSDLNQDFIVITSIARGISAGDVLGGMSWGHGDDALWSFRKVGDKLHVLRRNVRFRARPGTPEASAVELAYSDSVLYALPILTNVSGGYLVDMTRIFMSDDQQIGRTIGFSFAADRSTWAKVKAFPRNVELQVAAVYTGSRSLETIADPRGIQVNVHYSISQLPSTGYKPRIADDRVGYFLTVVKDFSTNDDEEHFVRYINRWDLQKEDPKAELSRPRNPIRFYIEKTVPRELRPYVQEGIEEWNKAFEKLGYYKAIEVLQQREDDDWDPEDIRYNTFRWITAEAGFAMGPSRVNPKTGQILDADIIFDASFLRYWSQDYETFGPDDAHRLMGRPAPLLATDSPEPQADTHRCLLGRGMQQQMGFAAAALLTQGRATAEGKLPPEFLHQALKEVVMHEVGHTLGLRHNFKASAWKSLEEINSLDMQADQATVASVMDYSPANIAPQGQKQGPYYTPTIGPYDHWVIEYGYRAFSKDEDAELARIAARSVEPGHDYATDEDTRSVDSDPLSNRFDLGKDPVRFAERQMTLSTDLLPKVVERSVEAGDGFQRARQMFGMLFSEYWRTAAYAARFPGGVHVYRDHKQEDGDRVPFEIVSAEQQRDAMKLLARTAFGTPEYDPRLLNSLAPSRWSHWGMQNLTRLDYPIHDVVSLMQEMLLAQLLDAYTLTRLHDSELKVPDDADLYTLAEHLRKLVDALFTEWQQRDAEGEYSNREPYISSFRRNLQRTALGYLIDLVTTRRNVPPDARSLARMHLLDLKQDLDRLLTRKALKLDDYSRAHLLDSQRRIEQMQDAQLELRSVD